MNNYYLADEAATENLGRRVALLSKPRMVIFLTGDLGAGKTTWVRGFLSGLGMTSAVKSPTYTLVEPYQVNGRQIFHFDLYRIAEPDELEFVGLREYFAADAICLVEWPERGQGYLPKADLHCRLSLQGEGREARIEALSALGKEILLSL